MISFGAYNSVGALSHTSLEKAKPLETSGPAGPGFTVAVVDCVPQDERTDGDNQGYGDVRPRREVDDMCVEVLFWNLIIGRRGLSKRCCVVAVIGTHLAVDRSDEGINRHRTRH